MMLQQLLKASSVTGQSTGDEWRVLDGVIQL